MWLDSNEFLVCGLIDIYMKCGILGMLNVFLEALLITSQKEYTHVECYVTGIGDFYEDVEFGDKTRFNNNFGYFSFVLKIIGFNSWRYMNWLSAMD